MPPSLGAGRPRWGVKVAGSNPTPACFGVGVAGRVYPRTRESDARARRHLPRLHRRGWTLLADGVRPQLPGDPLRGSAGMDGALALASR